MEMRTNLLRLTLLSMGGFVVLLVLLLTIRFLFGGNEDLWICQDHVWVAHGHPSYPRPADPCGKKEPLPKTKDACLQVGGVWKKQGPEPFETCNRKAADRGTICTDNSECEGWCQAEITKEQVREGMTGKLDITGRGRCSVWRVELGCFGMVQQGKVLVICID